MNFKNNNSFKNYNSNKKTHSNRPFSSLTRSNQMNNQIYLNQNSNLPLINNNININYENLNNDDEFSLIQNMWEDLGVTNEFQSQFIEYVQNLKDKERKDYFSLEKKIYNV